MGFWWAFGGLLMCLVGFDKPFWWAFGWLLVSFWLAFGRLLMGLWWTLVGEKSASIIKKHKLNDKNEIKKSKRE